MLARWKIELSCIPACNLSWLLKLSIAAIKRPLFAIHVLFGLNRSILISFVHLNLSASPHMISNDLLVKRNLQAGCNLTCRGVELVIQNLIVVDQSRSLRTICMLLKTRLATGRVEEGAAKCLASWVLLCILAAPFLTSL